MLNRRKLLAFGGVAVGGALVVPESVRRTAAAAAEPPGMHGIHRRHLHQAGTIRPHAGVPEFSVQMPIPKVLLPFKGDPDIDFYRVAIKQANAEILPGVQTPVMTYNGDFVGPTIRARTGRPVSITFANQLTQDANVHLHGGHVPPSSDGHPMDLIAPGGYRTYAYPNRQQGATLWYHAHSHHTEAEHVYNGQHAFYIVDDPAEASLKLPSGKYDVPIMLRDALFDESGKLDFLSPPPFRNVDLANGRPQPFFPVAARKYRFRFLNSATERNYILNLGGVDMIQIASDGGLLPVPVPRKEFRLSSGERIDIVIDFSKFPVGTKLVLGDVQRPVLRFDVTSKAIDDSRVPDTLRALPGLATPTFERTVDMKTVFNGEIPDGVINGKIFDPNRVDFQIKRGTTEIWNIVNGDSAEGWAHNFHMHLVQFRVLSRAGRPPEPDDRGRKDTIMLPANEPVRIQATFDGDFTGRYVYHCHFLEHSSIGMMGQMEITP
nr:multicopper oxidase family protein [Kibdelosporangium sp. MJ126-NF4]CEL14201.1 Multicopper oxidase [Kibdelosporangium sp. MJ126-NF4]CTQ88569.1 Multicopper oxidase [Kibdelosporangium sp. MJ126-NF4]